MSDKVTAAFFLSLLRFIAKAVEVAISQYEAYKAGHITPEHFDAERNIEILDSLKYPS